GRQVYTTIPEIVDPQHSALLIVDMQNDFLSKGGASDRAGRLDVAPVSQLIAQNKRVIEAARLAGALIVYIQNTWLPHYKSVSGAWLRFMERSGFPSGGMVTVDGAWGHQVVDELAPRPDDLVVKKWRSSAFIGTNMDMLLRSDKIESVVVTGVVTQGCVESTARDAAFADYYVVVLRDCVQSTNRELHEASLKVMSTRFDVVDSTEVLRVWAPLSVPVAAQ
ncbi:MAG: isochorismatase family cysteine hydrolase, partial [Chloroflexota bacterium]